MDSTTEQQIREAACDCAEEALEQLGAGQQPEPHDPMRGDWDYFEDQFEDYVGDPEAEEVFRHSYRAYIIDRS